MLAILRWPEEIRGIQSELHIKGNRLDQEMWSGSGILRNDRLLELYLAGIIPSNPVNPI